MTTTTSLLLSSSLSPFAFRSGKGDVVHAAAKTRSSSLVLPCCARVSSSIKLDGGAAARIRPCFHALIRYNGIGCFSGFYATSSPPPPQFVVRNQAEETEPMHSDKTYKIFSGTAKPKQCQRCMGPDFKIKQFKGCGKNVELPENVVGCHVYLLYHISPSPPAHNNVEELLFMIDACKAGSATNITVVIPLAAKVPGKELFNLVKEIACEVAPDREVHEILSFDFDPMLCYQNPQPDIAIDAKVEFLRNVNGDNSTILIENILRKNGAYTSFLRKNVYTCDKYTDSVNFLNDAIISSILPKNPTQATSEVGVNG